MVCSHFNFRSPPHLQKKWPKKAKTSFTLTQSAAFFHCKNYTESLMKYYFWQIKLFVFLLFFTVELCYFLKPIFLSIWHNLIWSFRWPCFLKMQPLEILSLRNTDWISKVYCHMWRKWRKGCSATMQVVVSKITSQGCYPGEKLILKKSPNCPVKKP